MRKIRPCLWFDTQAGEAAAFYTSIFKNSTISHTTYYGESGPMPAGAVLVVEFEIDGQPLIALNGGPAHTFNEAVSLQISCETQEEVDQLWEKLSEGGIEDQCGWLKDKYGLSWQVVPAMLPTLLSDPDPERAARAMKAMLGMRKLDIAALQAAADS